MLSGKAKRFLRSMAMEMDPVMQMGKSGASPSFIAELEDALSAHELVKVKILSNSAEEVKTVAPQLAKATGAELVQVIGRNALFFRPSPDKPKIELP